MVSVRIDQELASCHTESVPVDSNIDPMLAKAEAISKAGSTSVVTYLEKCKKCCGAAVRKEKKMIEDRSEKEGEDVLLTSELRFPYSLWRSS